MNDILFSPIKLKKLELRNRVVLAPLCHGVYPSDGTVAKETIAYLEARAEGGVGLIISQASRATRHQTFPIYLGAHEDRLMPSLRQYADAAHRYGARVFLQITAMGGTDPLGSYAPSAINIPWYSVLPKELTKEQIEEIIGDYVKAALRAKKVGMDGVELHGAYGYLIAEFISPLSNRRSDEYGGDFEKRMRVPVEIVRGIRDVCGNDFPVGFKFNAYEDVPGGIDQNLGLEVADIMVDEGVVYVHPVVMAAKWLTIPILYDPIDTMIPMIERVKRRVGEVPVIAAGGIKDPVFAEKIVASGKADMVALGRALLADPRWVNNAKSSKRIRPCIRCQVCHYEAISNNKKIVCTVNPYLMKETEETLRPAATSRNVMVAGGGPAGMTAAVVASRRGHRVTLCERRKELGGLLIAGSRPQFKADVLDLLNYLREEVADSDVEVKLGQEVTAEKVLDLSPDCLVVAVGASAMVASIKGIEKANVVGVEEALLTPELVGKEPLIIGGGETGCEAALYLSQQGRKVTIVEKLTELMPLEEIGYKYTTGVMQRMLTEAKVRVCVKAEVSEVTSSKAWLMFGATTAEIPADTIVLSVGLAPEKSKIESLKASCHESYVIGDCASPARIREAICEGDRIGRAI